VFLSKDLGQFWKLVGAELLRSRTRLEDAVNEAQRLVAEDGVGSSSMSNKFNQLITRSACLCRESITTGGPNAVAVLKEACSKGLTDVNKCEVLDLARKAPVDKNKLAEIAKSPPARALYQTYTAYKTGLHEFETIASRFGIAEGSSIVSCLPWKETVSVIAIFSILQAFLRKLKPIENTGTVEDRGVVVRAALADIRKVGGRVPSALLDAVGVGDASEAAEVASTGNVGN